MMRIVALACICAVVLLAAAPAGLAQAPRKTVMVVDFADRVGGWSDSREAVTTRVIKLRDDQRLRVLPRDKVQEALQQAKVETVGFIDAEDAQKVAKALEADYLADACLSWGVPTLLSRL